MSTPDPLSSIARLLRIITGSGHQPIVENVPRDLPPQLPANVAAPPTILSEGGRRVIRRPNPQRYFAQHGILPIQEASNPLLSSRIYEAIFPWGYGARQPGPEENYDSSQSRAGRAARALLGIDNSPRSRALPTREDAWRLYLGLPQESNTFRVSVHVPSRGTENKPYFSVNKIEDDPESFLTTIVDINRLGLRNDESSSSSPLKNVLGAIEGNGGAMQIDDQFAGVMGRFTLSKGRDSQGPYISYYDRWDLDPTNPSGSRMKLADRVVDSLGRPFEIYGRIYYDPKTWRVITPRRRTGRSGSSSP